eukprot:TRINITY_DN1142_c0_g1_i7.p1 TRINITY_DN1142_c0_g1~~TRINITY_DN1142_c0_g1_i7.p1  ORF type:complete len:362 (+),score=70.19 TRINITY_DN1142_c0_g1_i7:658-1743(+)
MCLAKEMYPGNYNATKTHYFIRLLHEKGLLLRNFTQNIDTLEQVAGIPADKLVFAHGSFSSAHCVGCHKEHSVEFVKQNVFADQVPHCECGSLVKPDIVFFGESLPERFFTQLTEDFPKCDLLLILGTSLAVHPFARLINFVDKDVPRLLVNREPVGTPILRYEEEDNTRDVFWAGDCDTGCQTLADLLGWGKELQRLVLENIKPRAPAPAEAAPADLTPAPAPASAAALMPVSTAEVAPKAEATATTASAEPNPVEDSKPTAPLPVLPVVQSGPAPTTTQERHTPTAAPQTDAHPVAPAEQKQPAEAKAAPATEEPETPLTPTLVQEHERGSATVASKQPSAEKQNPPEGPAASGVEHQS